MAGVQNDGLVQSCKDHTVVPGAARREVCQRAESYARCIATNSQSLLIIVTGTSISATFYNCNP
jgi:hypothetical protein